MSGSLALALRVGFSLMIVLALMGFAARMVRGKLGTRGAGTLEVLARQQVGRGASVALIRVADRALIVGVTEHGITLLGEPIADLASLAVVKPAAEITVDSGLDGVFPGLHRGSPSSGPTGVDDGRLRGSVLSPTTWRQMIALIRERTVRRG